MLSGLLAIPAISATILPSHDNVAANPSKGFISFPVSRGERSSRTLTGRQATASLVNEQDTSYVIERELPSYLSPHYITSSITWMLTIPCSVISHIRFQCPGGQGRH